MAHAPGYLDDLDAAALAEWGDYLAGIVAEAAADGRAEWNRPPALVADDTPGLGVVAALDWPGEPKRIVDFLSDKPPAQVAGFLDWVRPRGQVGRVIAHEEYLEWRVVRENGEIARIEFTTETPDYMGHLAAHDPARLLQLAAAFADEAQADALDIYGSDPFAMSVEQRRTAFRNRNTSSAGVPISNYNNGTKAMMCMCQSVNSVSAALILAVRAAFPVGEGGRPLTGPEAIVGQGWAASCRNSDPFIVDAIVNATFHGSKVALADPPGLYLLPLRDDAITLDGDPLPAEWLTYSRGTAAADNPATADLWQRLVLAPPAGSARRISELRDANGDPVEHGVQVAREQHVALRYRLTPPGQVETIEVAPRPRPDPCGRASPDAVRYRRWFDDYVAEQAAAPAAPTERATPRLGAWQP